MYDRASDRDLALRAAGGDEGAQAALVERAKLPLAGFFNHRGAGEAVLDDLVQEALIDALDSLHNFNEPFLFVGWTMSIAARIWSRHCKRESKQRQRLQELWHRRRLEQQDNGRDAVPYELLEELARLPREKRQLLYDRYVNRLTLEKLGERHGMTTSTARREVEEASALVRRRISRTSGEALPDREMGPRRKARGKVSEP